MKRPRALRQLSTWLLIAVLLVLVFAPFYWIAVSSLKTPPEVIRYPPTLFPQVFTLRNFQTLFTATDYPRYLWNSLFIALTTTLITVPMATLASYAIYRLDFPGRFTILKMLIGAYVFPSILLLIPLFQIMVQIGLINSLWSLIVANVTFTAPFSVWLMRAFLESIPLELEEAAAIDGAGFFETLGYVILPVLRPGMATIAIFTFITVWTEYPFASQFIIDDAKRPLPVGLAAIIGQYQIDWGLLAAGAVFMALPVVVMFAFVGRYFVEGLTAGALKE
jgi:multiple sugar transport system permease protein